MATTRAEKKVKMNVRCRVRKRTVSAVEKEVKENWFPIGRSEKGTVPAWQMPQHKKTRREIVTKRKTCEPARGKTG